jgi:hypothetical protein
MVTPTQSVVTHPSQEDIQRICENIRLLNHQIEPVTRSEREDFLRFFWMTFPDEYTKLTKASQLSPIHFEELFKDEKLDEEQKRLIKDFLTGSPSKSCCSKYTTMTLVAVVIMGIVSAFAWPRH